MAPPLPADLVPAAFMYLNPQLVAAGVVTTVEDVATAWAACNGFGYDSNVPGSGLPYKLPCHVGAFDERVYIADHRDGMDISALNSNVRAAMAAAGAPAGALEAQARYAGTILRRADQVAPGTFRFVDGG
jgi:hypothetical protein